MWRRLIRIAAAAFWLIAAYRYLFVNRGDMWVDVAIAVCGLLILISTAGLKDGYRA